MKVYELAKEYNIKSVDLASSARNKWKLPIRSYMEVLTPDQESFLRKKLGEEKKSAEGLKKTPKKIIKKSLKKAAAVKKAKPTAPAASPAPAPVQSRVIRRKAAAVKQAEEEKIKKTAQTKMEDKAPPVQAAKTEDKSPQAEAAEELRPLSEEIEESLREEERKKIAKKIEKKQSLQKFRASDFRKREIVFQPKKKRSAAEVLSSKKNQITIPKAKKRVVTFYEPISVQDLSHQMGIKLKKLLSKIQSEKLEPHTMLDFDMVSLIAGEFSFTAENREKTFEGLAEELAFGDLKAPLKPCPPVVTVMGHVDHGKTTLLDYLRKSQVAEKESGGITQHIGAYSVPVGKSFITFIDTPGHEAFSEMRARGAGLTHIVVLVVAGTEGVKSQTIEAIEHAKKAKVPILAAVNKMDQEGADLEKVKKQLSEKELLAEDWGGDVIFAPISAKTGKGIKELLEQILLLSEMQEIKANPKRSAKGIILDSEMTKGKGWVVSLIIQDGHLKKSHSIMTPSLLGKVRLMTNDRGQLIEEAFAGQAVQISGFDESPQVGDPFYAVKEEGPVKEFLSKQKKEMASSLPKASLEELLKKHSQKTKELPLVLKADCAGSLEAVKNSLSKIASDEVRVSVIHSGLGGITKSDILLASGAEGEVIGFNVHPSASAEKTAGEYGVFVRVYTIIYELIEEVRKRAIGILDPDIVDEVCGKAQVREIFTLSSGAVAGSFITEGKVNRKHLIRLIRDGRIVFDGKIKSLRRFKEDVSEVSEKYECGIGLEGFRDIKPGDMIESYQKKEIARTKL